VHQAGTIAPPRSVEALVGAKVNGAVALIDATRGDPLDGLG
jgi:hypothetical protein